MMRQAMFGFVLAASCMLLPGCFSQEIGAPVGSTRKPIAFSQSCAGSDKVVGIDAAGNILCATDETGAGSVPSGAVVLVISGSCATTLGAGWSEVSSLSGKFVLGTAAASGDIASAGGSDTITPAGTVSQPSFAGAQFTPAGTVSQPSFTGTPFTAVINHTHAVTVTDPGHTHVERMVNSGTAGTVGVQGASTASNANASNSASASATTGITATTANPAGGVSSITPAGTVSQPAFTGTPVTPAGTVSQPSFTGTAFDNRPAFVKVIFCRKD